MRAALLEDVNLDRLAARQSMRRACEANIIWPVGHLDHVDESFVDDAALDEALRGPYHRYVDRTHVVGGRDDEVSIGDDALVVGLVVMNKCAVDRLDDADALIRLAELCPYIWVCDAFIRKELLYLLCRIERLYCARPVVNEDIVAFSILCTGFLPPKADTIFS